MDDIYKVGFGLVLGAAVGVAAGMLLAPKSGKETRDDIVAKATEAQEKTQELMEQTRDRVEQIYDQGRDMVAEKRDWAVDALHSGKEALLGLRDEAQQDTKELAKSAHSRAKKLKTQVTD